MATGLAAPPKMSPTRRGGKRQVLCSPVLHPGLCKAPGEMWVKSSLLPPSARRR